MVILFLQLIMRIIKKKRENKDFKNANIQDQNKEYNKNGVREKKIDKKDNWNKRMEIR